MANSEYIGSPKSPFVLLSMGLRGFEGERGLWNLPEDKVGVYHILVRIKHELELLK